METRSDHLDFRSTGPLDLRSVAFRFLQEKAVSLSSGPASRGRLLLPQPQPLLASPLDTLLLGDHHLEAHVVEGVVMAVKADGSTRCEVTGAVQLTARRQGGALLTPPPTVVVCEATLTNIPQDKTKVTLTDSKTINVKRLESANNEEGLSYKVLLEAQAYTDTASPCAISYTLLPEKKLKIVAPQFKCEVDSRAGRTILSLSIRVLFHPLLGGCVAKRLQVQAALSTVPINSSRQLRLQPPGSYNEKTKVASWALDDHTFATSAEHGLVLQCLVALDGPAPAALPQVVPLIVRAGGCALKQLLSGAELSLRAEGARVAAVTRTGSFDVKFL